MILHADVVGSTRLVTRDERVAHERIQDVFRRLVAWIAAYGGTAHEVRGDAVVAEFSRASDAVCAALAFQADNAPSSAPPDEPMHPALRIGIALGEVVIADRTITGSGVVLAQRIEQLAPPGGVVLQSAVYEATPRRLPLRYAPLGERVLKGFDEPVRVFSVSLAAGAQIPSPETRGNGGARARPRRPGRTVLALGAVLLAAGLAAAGLWLTPWKPAAPPESSGPQSSEPPVIAVLPFRNLGPAAEEDYFSDGLTNELIVALSKFRSLVVIASDSVFTYKGVGVSADEVRRDLGASYVLEGTVQRAAGQVRVGAELLDTGTGRTIWADRYTRPLESLFPLQEELVRAIVTNLAIRVDALERERAFRAPAENLEAYEYVLRGREFLSRETREANRQAREMFRKASELDPRYPAARLGTAWALRQAIGYGWEHDPRAALDEAQTLAYEALRSEESDEAHRLLADIYLVRAQYDLALREVERALELNPNDASSYAALGEALLWAGDRLDEAIGAFENAARFNPRMPRSSTLLKFGLAYYLAGRYQDAVGMLEQGRGLNPENSFLQAALAAAYAQAGRRAAAERAASEVRRLNPFFAPETFGSRLREPSDRDHLAAGLRKAGLG